MAEISGCEYDYVVSSANKTISNNEAVFVVSFTHKIKNNEPKIGARGTPHLICLYSESHN